MRVPYIRLKRQRAFGLLSDAVGIRWDKQLDEWTNPQGKRFKSQDEIFKAYGLL